MSKKHFLEATTILIRHQYHRWIPASLLGLGLMLIAGTGWAECTGEFSETRTLTWNGGGFSNGGITAGSNYDGSKVAAGGTGGNDNVTVNITLDNAVNTSVGWGSTPNINETYSRLKLFGEWPSSNQAITVEFSFENAQGFDIPVNNVEFTLYDIDEKPGDFRDQVEISTGTLTPASNPTFIINPDSATATTGVNTHTNCHSAVGENIRCQVSADSGPTPIASLTLTYKNNPDNSTACNGGPCYPEDPDGQSFWIGDVTFCVKPNTLPITLASADSHRKEDGQIQLKWTTATETRNVGFHVYGRSSSEEKWYPLTTELIPSQVIDSLEPQRYLATVPGTAVEELLLEDWDTQGQRKRHGPFTVGQSYGLDAVTTAIPLDWAAIRAENASQRTRTLATAHRTATATQAAPDALLWVTTPGIQRVSFNDLQAAGANFSGVALTDLALTDNGQQKPRHILDNNQNGLFDHGDAVEFLGEITPTLYSARNAYRLHLNAQLVNAASSETLNSQSAVTSVFPHKITFEQQREYSFAAPGNDPWYDQWLLARSRPVTLQRRFDLPGYADGSANLTLSLWGVTDWPGDDPDHHLVIKVNGEQIDESWFDGSVDASRDLTLPAGLLRETGNTLTLEAPGDTGYAYDVQALDHFTVHYDRHTRADRGAWQGRLPTGTEIKVEGFQGEVIAWHNNQRRIGENHIIIKDAGQWVAADSRAIHRPTVETDLPIPADNQTAGGVDYLIISHPVFIDSAAMGDLVALQESRGYETAVIDVDTLYAAYTDYEVSPEAIRQYIKQVKPRFALLVGGDSYDYHDYKHLASQSFIPTYYAQTDDLVTYAPADGHYADYNGNGIAQLPLGRLPVRTVTELTQLVAKLESYTPPNRAVLSAGPSGSGRQYAAISDNYATYLPGHWSYSQAYMDDAEAATVQAILQTELNLSGALVSYIGHSSYAIWGLNPSQGLLLRASQVRQLNNPTPHLITQWGCWNTYFVNPNQETMANAFLFQNQGAAAVIGATALTDLNLLSGLGNEFFQQIGQEDTLGEAFVTAQQRYAQQHAVASRLRGFILLGDPAAELR